MAYPPLPAQQMNPGLQPPKSTGRPVGALVGPPDSFMDPDYDWGLAKTSQAGAAGSVLRQQQAQTVGASAEGAQRLELLNRVRQTIPEYKSSASLADDDSVRNNIAALRKEIGSLMAAFKYYNDQPGADADEKAMDILTILIEMRETVEELRKMRFKSHPATQAERRRQALEQYEGDIGVGPRVVEASDLPDPTALAPLGMKAGGRWAQPPDWDQSSLDLLTNTAALGEQFGRGAGAGPQDPLEALRRMLMGPIEPGSSPMTIPPSFGEAGRLLAPRLPPRPTTTASEYPQPSVLPLPPEYQ